MAIKSVYILNKAGSLLYQRDFGKGLNKLGSNDYLVLAGTLHSVHALSTRISPLSRSSGLSRLETPSFTLHCYQTQTGVKLIIVTDGYPDDVAAITSKLYALYSDYVLKNPFYALDMPIRGEKFEKHLESLIESNRV